MSNTQPWYVESTIIMTTVRLVAPFVLTFGLFVMFHGADSPGGGFQGGVIVASVLVMLAFAFGIDVTRRWLRTTVIVGLVTVGVSGFVGLGAGTVALGGMFLEYTVYPIDHASKYSIELVEIAIAMIVTGIVTSMFFAIASGVSAPQSEDPVLRGEDG